MGISKKKVTMAPVQDVPVTPSSLVSLRKTAAVSLKKNGLAVDGTGGIAVYLVLDHSGSMHRHYSNGDVQRITDQVLALTLEIDDDGQVPVFYFGTNVSPPVTATAANYQGFVDRTHSGASWGTTNYADTIREVARYHRDNGQGRPGIAVFQTDGSPDNRRAAETALKDVSSLNLFFAFVGFGPEQQVDFLFKLDEISGRVRDNASAFHASDPRRTRDSDLYDGILKEFTSDWLPQVL